jgi:peptide subunit release factor 1 (eRF1)
MSQVKYLYRCPACHEERTYTPTTIAKGVCRNCGIKFTTVQMEQIGSGIKDASDVWKLDKINSVIGRRSKRSN